MVVTTLEHIYIIVLFHIMQVVNFPMKISRVNIIVKLKSWADSYVKKIIQRAV